MVWSNVEIRTEERAFPFGNVKVLNAGTLLIPSSVDIEKGHNPNLTIGFSERGNPLVEKIKKNDRREKEIFLLLDFEDMQLYIPKEKECREIIDKSSDMLLLRVTRSMYFKSAKLGLEYLHYVDMDSCTVQLIGRGYREIELGLDTLNLDCKFTEEEIWNWV